MPASITLPLSPKHYPFLVQDSEAKLISLLYNYFSLGQFELGRSLLPLIYLLHPSKTEAILHNLLEIYGFPCNWLSSVNIPSSAHFAWLCAAEYVHIQQKFNANWPGVPTPLLHSIEFAILLHDSLGESGDDNMVIEAVMNELCTYQQIITDPSTSVSQKNIKISDFALTQLSKVFVLFPLLGRAIFKYLEGPQTKPALNIPSSPPLSPSLSSSSPSLFPPASPTVWAMHNINVQMIMDELRKQQYEEVYGHLQVLYPASISADTANLSDSSFSGNSTLRNIHKLLNTIAGFCFTNNEVANGTENRASSPTIRDSNPYASIPNEQSIMNIKKVYEGLLQCHNTAGLLVFSKELQKFLEENNTDDVVVPMPFNIVNNSKSAESQHKFWIWYHHYVSVNNYHFLDHTISTILQLVNKHQFTEAANMLTTFEEIRGLVFLMSWDRFEDDVLSKLKMANELWSKREKREKREQNNFPLAGNADQVAFHVRQMWWVVSQLHPELASSDSQDKGALNKKGQEILSSLQAHSLAYVTRHSLPHIQPEEVIRIVQENPDRSANADVLKDQDSDLLHSYYIIKHILSLFSGTTKHKESSELNQELELISKLLDNEKSDLTKLTLLEIIYLCIFVNTSHLKEGGSSPTHTTKTREDLPNQESQFIKLIDHSTASANTVPAFHYLASQDLVGGLLGLLQTHIKDVSASQTIPKDNLNRVEKFSKLIVEANTRFELVKSIPQPATQNSSFMSRMSASPTTLLTNCMREGNYYNQCDHIVQFFSLQEHPLAQEAHLANKLDSLNSQSAANPEEVASDLQGQSAEVNFTTRVDLAVTTPSADLSKKLQSKWDPPSELETVFVEFINHAQCLSNHFSKASLRAILSNINQLLLTQKNSTQVVLESQLSNQRVVASNVTLLQKLVDELHSSGTSITDDDIAKVINMIKVVGGLEGEKYMRNFLEHSLSIARALERQPDCFKIVNQGPKQIVEDLVYNVGKAEELAKILNLDSLGSIFSSLFKQTSGQTLQPELVQYLSMKSPVIASLACVLRSPEPTAGNTINAYTNSALSLAKDYPTLLSWILTHSDAKELFWKTFSDEDSSVASLDNLSEDDKAVYRLADNTEEIPEAFYAKVVSRLIERGALAQAVDIADHNMVAGAADWQLRVMAEGSDDVMSSWSYVSAYKTAAAGLVLKWYTSWTLDVCLDMLFMCKCHLNKSVDPTSPRSPSPRSPPAAVQTATNTATRDTIDHLYSQMQTFKAILAVDSAHWEGKWQAISELVQRDPVALIRRLLGLKQYVLARKVRELFVVPNIKSEIDESYLLHLLEQNDTSTALKTLVELGEDSIKIVESLSAKIQENYSTKLFLVQFLMGNMSSALSAASYQALSTRETGIKVLLKLPKELQQQYAKLIDYPSLIIESLIMDEMAPQVHRLLSEIPSLRDDDMILKYASKALAFRTAAPDDIKMHSTVLNTPPGTPQATSEINNTTPAGNTTTPGGPTVSPEPSPTLAGLPTTPSRSSLSSSRRTRRAKWHLSPPPADAPVRAAHYFPAAPSISLAKALFDIVGDRRRAGQTCLSVCTGLAQRLSAVYSDENLLIISLIRQLLLYAKLQFMQDPKGGGSDGVATCDTFLGKVELFQELVIAKSTFNASLEDLSDPQKARHLRDKLIASDRLKFAIDVATKCNILPDPAWLAWGLSLLAIGKYTEAREKFKYCLASATERRAASSTVTHPHSDMVDPANVLNKVIAVLESQPAPQPLYLRHLCDKLMTDPQNAKGGNYYDEMSVDAFLNAMHVGGPSKGPGTPTKGPSTPTKFVPSSPAAGSQKVPLSSIDNERYDEAMGLINFQMRHNKLADAINAIVADGIPPNIFHEELFLPCLSRGTIVTLFESAKKSSVSLQKLNPHLTHTCKMLLQAKHYQLLQTVQVFMGDPVRAGLTSIKMYMEQQDTLDFDHKIKILEDAKRYFQEGLSSKTAFSQSTGDAEIAKYAQTTNLQIEVTTFLHSQGKAVPPTALKLTLFGSPSHKSDIAELLYNFALAFRIMQDFRLPFNTIYLNAICTLSRKKQVGKVNDLLKEIRGTCNDNDWDEIVLASIKVYVSELQDIKTAEKIAAKLVGSRSKVVASILCGKRKAAYLQAVRDNDRVLVQLVCKEAEKANDVAIFGLCEKYLSQNE